MPGGTRRSTIKQIARQVGVSVTTVSRALNDKPDIHPATKARILAVAAQLGYTPNPMARSLVSQRTFTLGLAVRTISDMWVAQIVPAIEELARANGYEVFLSTHYADPEREFHVLEAFHQRYVEGILVVSSTLGDAYPTLQEKWGIPIILISPLIASPHRYVVRTDDVGGAQAATAYLIQLGHRRIGHIGVPTWTLPGRERLDGYRQALEAHGLAYDERWVVLGDADVTGGLEGARQILSLPNPPTALFCFNDLTAVGVLRAAREQGLRVPQDLAVVGFDDVPFACYVDPPLSTIRQDMRALGYQATRMVLDWIAGQEPEAPLELQTHLVVRESTAPPGGESEAEGRRAL
ncbi:MAG: LacI family DNA-binding transcriptional regulator [Anaerolineae bacterium]